MTDTEQAPGASVGQATPESRLAAMFGAEDERLESPAADQYQVGEEATETQETDEQTEEAETEQATEQEASAEDDGLVEFEFEGETLRGKPALRDAVLRRQDYTRKTQEVAEMHRHVTALAEHQRQLAEFHKATQQEQGELAALENQLKAAKAMDWSTMDSETLIRNKHYVDQLRDRANELKEALQGKQAEFQNKERERIGQMAQAAYAFVSKAVPGFTSGSELEKSVAKYAEDSGMPVDAFVRGVLAYPSVAVLAYKAMQYDKLQQSKATTVQAVKKAAPVLKPGATKQAGNQAAMKSREVLKKTGTRQAAAAFFRHFEG